MTKTEPKLSAAAKKARERLNSMEEMNRAPTIDPAVGVNRAKQEAGTPTAPTDTQNPGATAQVNGQAKAGQESPDAGASGLSQTQAATLPADLTAAQVKSLEAGGVKTLTDSLKLTDAQLEAIPGVGEGAITTLRDAAKAQGLTWAQSEGSN